MNILNHHFFKYSLIIGKKWGPNTSSFFLPTPETQSKSSSFTGCKRAISVRVLSEKMMYGGTPFSRANSVRFCFNCLKRVLSTTPLWVKRSALTAVVDSPAVVDSRITALRIFSVSAPQTISKFGTMPRSRRQISSSCTQDQVRDTEDMLLAALTPCPGRP